MLSIKDKLHNFIRRATCPFKLVKEYIPLAGDIYDFGCGFGILKDYLFSGSGVDCNFVGFDIDEDKIRYALKSNKHSNVKFIVGDITKDLSISNATCVVLNDVLFCILPSEQDRLLRRCFSYLSDNGVLLIKEIDIRPIWKYFFHQFQETFVMKVFGFTKGKGIFCFSRKHYISTLEKIGYKVEVVDIQKGYPYPHILYVCRK